MYVIIWSFFVASASRKTKTCSSELYHRCSSSVGTTSTRSCSSERLTSHDCQPTFEIDSVASRRHEFMAALLLPWACL